MDEFQHCMQGSRHHSGLHDYPMWKSTFSAVDLAIFIVEAASAYRLVALAADETSHVERILQSVHHLLMAVQSAPRPIEEEI